MNDLMQQTFLSENAFSSFLEELYNDFEVLIKP